MFKSIDPKALDTNFFSLLDDRWGILTVKTDTGCNPMTVSWGGAGGPEGPLFCRGGIDVDL